MMTTEIITPNTFALTAGEGRTLHPLNILGTDVLVKLANADSDGAVAVFEHAVAPKFGPPLHRHSREDEWFYVLDGKITAEIDGQRIVLRKAVLLLHRAALRTRIKTSTMRQRRS
jgi:quercetin dioxygenase-like cupin family protein